MSPLPPRSGEAVKISSLCINVPTRNGLATLLPPRGHITKDGRDKLVTEAYLSHGYTLKEIADHLHLHYATISRAVKRMIGKNV
jgi:AraC-like DNA-binding protein